MGYNALRLAGLPRTVIRRASQLLRGPRDRKSEEGCRGWSIVFIWSRLTPLPHLDEEVEQAIETEVQIIVNPIHEEIVESLSTMQLDDYSPFEALQALYQMQKKLKRVKQGNEDYFVSFLGIRIDCSLFV